MSPTVFIIGASRGIGRGLVDTFLRAGWDVHATVRSTNVTLPPSVVTVLDVENDEQIEQVANNVYGNPIDLLIHNAGVKPSDKISNDQCLNINTEGPFRVLKAFMKSITQPESQKRSV